MTEAQQAAQRLFASTPAERIHTHERRPYTSASRAFTEPDEVKRIRGWIGKRMRKMGAAEMARELDLPVYIVHNHLQAIRGTGKYRSKG